MGAGLIDALRRYDNLTAIDDDDIPEDVRQAAIDTVAAEVGASVDNFCDYIKHRDARAEEIREHIKDAQAALKRLENGTERIKNAAAYYLTKTGQKTAQGLIRRVSVRESERTIIDDANSLPAKYTRQTVKIEPDKAAIKDALKAGEIVRGAHIEKANYLTIK